MNNEAVQRAIEESTWESKERVFVEHILSLCREYLDEDLRTQCEAHVPTRRPRGPGWSGQKPLHHDKRWTAQMHDDLRAYLLAEWSYKRIADRMGRNKKAISEQVRVLRVRDGL